MGDVRDVHAEPEVAVLQPLDGYGIVEVAGVLAVDGDRRHRAEIGAAADVTLLDRCPDAPCLLDRLLWMRVGYVELADDDLGVDAWLVDVAKHFRDAAYRTPRRRRPARDLHDDHLARFRREPLPRRHVHVGEHAPVEWHDITQPFVVHFETSDQAFLAALEDADNAPFEAFRRLPLDARDDAIPVHGFAEIRCGDVDVLALATLGVLGHDESETRRIGLQLADDQIHLVGNPVAVAPNLQQLAAGGERLELAPERVAFFARHAKQLRQFARGGGVMDAVADEFEEIAGVGHATRITCKSPTFVHVGPVRIRSPRASKNAYVLFEAR